MKLIKSILIESLSTKGLTALQHGILKRIHNQSLDLDSASESTYDNIEQLEDKGLMIKNRIKSKIDDELIPYYELTDGGINMLDLLNSVGTKEKSISKSRNRLRPKIKIGDTDINLRTGNKFKNNNRHKDYRNHPELKDNEGKHGGPRAKSNRMKHVRDLFGLDDN